METKEQLYKRLKKKRVNFNFDDPASELEAICDRQKLEKQNRISHSKLDLYRAEILELRDSGATVTQVHLWLDGHGIDCNRSTVSRWLKKNEQKQATEEGQNG